MKNESKLKNKINGIATIILIMISIKIFIDALNYGSSYAGISALLVGISMLMFITFFLAINFTK